jgi:hypothetical protein
MQSQTVTPSTELLLLLGVSVVTQEDHSPGGGGAQLQILLYPASPLGHLFNFSEICCYILFQGSGQDS